MDELFIPLFTDIGGLTGLQDYTSISSLQMNIILYFNGIYFDEMFN